MLWKTIRAETDTARNDFDLETAGRLAELFSALADATRVRIISLIAEREICVHELCAMLGMTQSAISHQLRVLRDRRIVRYRKQGRHVYYQLDDEHISELFRGALDHIKHTH
ncbi:MAG: helix-turn-helix transcriptional regulator [Deltaproteobacteria bacterium]|nr:helix-turn-helix transcriptional regulator [Deltaproteobacteria bacterium]